MSKTIQPSTPILVLIRGLPGSGKTYISLALQPRLQETYGEDGFILLDPDATNYESQAYKDHTAKLTAEGVDKILHPYRFLRAQAYEAIIKHQVIVWNQPFTNRESLEKVLANLQGYAEEHDTTLPVMIVEVELDPAVAKQRVDNRKSQGGHGPSDNTFNRFTKDYTSFADLGHPTVTVHGNDDVNISVSAIIEQLKKIGK